MNFLAHLFLSCRKPELIVGNFLGDYLHNDQLAHLPDPIRAGIQLHRRIDSFTDQHPVVRRSTRRLHNRHHKYASVLVDIYYDYFLVKNWGRYSDQDLASFTQEMYRILEDFYPVMPERLQRRVSHMIEDDWLMRYGTLDGIREAIDRLKKRTSRPEYLEGALESLLENEVGLNDDFNAFFPDVYQMVTLACEVDYS